MTVVRNEYERGENDPFEVLFKRLLSVAYDCDLEEVALLAAASCPGSGYTARVSDVHPLGEDAAAAEGQSPASAAALAETPSSSPQV